MRICLDPGHGGRDPGATGNGLQEKNIVLDVALNIRKLLLRNWHCEVKMTRDSDVFVSAADRVKIANNWGADLFYSVHCNGHHTDANGWETFTHPLAPVKTRQIQRTIHFRLWNYLKKFNTRDRGLKTKDLYVLRFTRMSSVLGEYLFVTGSVDHRLLKNPEVIEGMARATAEGMAEALGLKEKVNGTPIVGNSKVSLAQAQEWAKNRGAHPRFVNIAPVYWEIGQVMGIRPEVAYAQAAKETAFGWFGGSVQPEQNNWAGIKTREAEGNRREDHETFPTPAEGVRAHFNHLAAYVGLEPLGVPHGRYYLVMSLPWAGKIKTVEELGGRWAPGADYGESIVRDYLEDLLKTEIVKEKGLFPDVPGDHWAAEAIAWVSKKGIMRGKNDGNFAPDESVTRAQLALVIKEFYRFIKEKKC